MPLKNIYRTSPSIITTADYNQFVTGAGVKTFYPCVNNDSAGVNYHLNENPVYTDEAFTDTVSTGLATGGTYSAESNVDFDTSAFSKTRVINGTAVLNMVFGWSDAGLDIQSASVKLSAQLFAWDGTTETALSSLIDSQDMGFAGVGVADRTMLTLEIPVVNKRVPAGSKLRLNIITYGKDADISAKGRVGFLHNPTGYDANRTTTVDLLIWGDPPTEYTHVAKLFVPFKQF